MVADDWATGPGFGRPVEEELVSYRRIHDLDNELEPNMVTRHELGGLAPSRLLPLMVIAECGTVGSTQTEHADLLHVRLFGQLVRASPPMRLQA